MVQVDEPALREGLPLKQERWNSYLKWAVDSFRLATAVAKPETQLVSHLCYSSFEVSRLQHCRGRCMRAWLCQCRLV